MELLEKGFRLLHISTDEVFGSLDSEGKFSEKSLMTQDLHIQLQKQAVTLM